MKKVLFYDFDRGLSTLGSPETIEKEFGYRPRTFIETKRAMELFDRTHKLKKEEIKDSLGTIDIEYYDTHPSIGFEVLDSISAYSIMKKKEVRGTAKKVTLPQYGEIKEDLEDLILALTRTNTSSILIGHTKTEKDEDLGILRSIPSVTGSMANEMGRLFDLVLYTEVQKDAKTGKRSYLWQVEADEKKAAKCRIQSIAEYASKNDGYIEQDYEKLFKMAYDEGIMFLKILVLGETGTGKTYALKTLKDLLGG